MHDRVENATPGSALRDITNSTTSTIKATSVTVKRPEVRLRERMAAEPKTIEELLALPDDLLPDIASMPPPPEIDEFAGLPSIEDLQQISGQLCVDEAGEDDGSRVLEETLRRFIVDPGDFQWSFFLADDDDILGEADPRPCYMFDDIPSQVECN